ncbi:MAG: hypothetical protein NXI22_14555 [bacterium]|nr:hypothetical protein [bacterium]
MALACQLTIDGDAHAAFVIFPNAFYMLPDETLARVSSELIWCETCDDFRAGEAFSPRSHIEKELTQSFEDVEQGVRVFCFNEDRQQFARHQESQKRTLNFIDLRQSFPRCLACGGREISKVSAVENEEFIDRRGRTVRHKTVFASTAIDHRLYLFDVDGAFLGEISRITLGASDIIDDAYDYNTMVRMLNEANRHNEL